MKSISTETRRLPGGERIEILYLDQASTRNSMTLEMGLSLNQTLHKLAGELDAPRALIITGKNGVFSSGGDFNLLRSFAEKEPEENREYMGSFYRLFLAVRDMPFVVLAAVNGHAVGASLALALACDFRYLVADARYALNFVRLGIHPGMGSSFLVKEVAGLAQAQELLFTGRYFSGEEALRRGLCHGLFPAESILEDTFAVAAEVARGAPLALRDLKRGLYRSQTLEAALDHEAQSQADHFASQDFRRALAAIEEKKEPQFEGD